MKKIIIIESDPTISNTLEDKLKDNFEITVAFSGTDGFDQIQEINPDIIVLDFLLPKLNGFQICSKLQKIPEFKETPIILLTDTDEVGKKFLTKFTINKYFKKPLNYDEVSDYLTSNFAEEEEDSDKFSVSDDSLEFLDDIFSEVGEEAEKQVGAKVAAGAVEEPQEEIPFVEKDVEKEDKTEFLDDGDESKEKEPSVPQEKLDETIDAEEDLEVLDEILSEIEEDADEEDSSDITKEEKTSVVQVPDKQVPETIATDLPSFEEEPEEGKAPEEGKPPSFEDKISPEEGKPPSFEDKISPEDKGNEVEEVEIPEIEEEVEIPEIPEDETVMVSKEDITAEKVKPDEEIPEVEIPEVPHIEEDLSAEKAKEVKVPEIEIPEVEEAPEEGKEPEEGKPPSFEDKISPEVKPEEVKVEEEIEIPEIPEVKPEAKEEKKPDQVEKVIEEKSEEEEEEFELPEIPDIEDKEKVEKPEEKAEEVKVEDKIKLELEEVQEISESEVEEIKKDIAGKEESTLKEVASEIPIEEEIPELEEQFIKSEDKEEGKPPSFEDKISPEEQVAEIPAKEPVTEIPAKEKAAPVAPETEVTPEVEEKEPEVKLAPEEGKEPEEGKPPSFEDKISPEEGKPPSFEDKISPEKEKAPEDQGLKEKHALEVSIPDAAMAARLSDEDKTFQFALGNMIFKTIKNEVKNIVSNMEIQKSIDNIIKNTIQGEILKAIDISDMEKTIDKNVDKFIAEKGTDYINEKIFSITKSIISEFMNTKGKEHIDMEIKTSINEKVADAFKMFGQSFSK